MKSQFFKDILSLIIVTSALVVFIFFSYGSSDTPTKKYIIHTNPLIDEATNDLIERDLEQVKGVINVDHDSDNDMIIIDSNSDIDLNNIKQIFNKWDSNYYNVEIENIFSFVD